MRIQTLCLVACVLVALVAATFFGPEEVWAASYPTRGDMSGNNSTDTTFTFDPVAELGVLVVNPDSPCVVAVFYDSGDTSWVPVVAASYLHIPGRVTSAIVDKSAVQRVGVYAVDE